ncbi:hypothetical protein LIER_41096 [Lithospermum erythrorhizon]|uniref:Reverse transcriptase/retrotransposon-derived protein RNase H-like domain-containing protein n=1 Tax=Lithospermum erythrorhizon TaxID=34254 RepID=A0AAV3R683_LITER
MKPPNSYKDVQKLISCLASLNRFTSRSSERNLPFFKTLRRMSKEKFNWDEESDMAFQELNKYLGSGQLLLHREPCETLQIYLAISDVAVSSVLVGEAYLIQKPIYYVSHVLGGADERYLIIDKASFALIISARMLKDYFESYPTKVITDQPLKRVLTSPALSGRLTT